MNGRGIQLQRLVVEGSPPPPSKSTMPMKSTGAIVDLASADSDSALSDISD